MHFAVTILGNNSAIPSNGRHPTAQVVNLHDQLFLIDCGEGTQMQMSLYKIRRSKIDNIFISHLHGDHYFGLIGLINSYGLQNRNTPLHIYGPPPLENIIQLQLDCAHTELPYPLLFHALNPGQNDILLQTEGIEVSAFPTSHRIDCFGFIFKERHDKRKIIPEKTKQWDIPYTCYKQLQEGDDYRTPTGETIANERLTSPPPRERTYAFCADTRYDENMLRYVSSCDVLYHETTYLQADKDKALSRYHSTAQQAAILAKKAAANQLLIGHFSSKYTELSAFEQEARAVFPNTTVTQEGTTYFVNRPTTKR